MSDVEPCCFSEGCQLNYTSLCVQATEAGNLVNGLPNFARPTTALAPVNSAFYNILTGTGEHAKCQNVCNGWFAEVCMCDTWGRMTWAVKVSRDRSVLYWRCPDRVIHCLADSALVWAPCKVLCSSGVPYKRVVLLAV